MLTLLYTTRYYFFFCLLVFYKIVKLNVFIGYGFFDKGAQIFYMFRDAA